MVSKKLDVWKFHEREPVSRRSLSLRKASAQEGFRSGRIVDEKNS
jgi:hypothetical protein